MSLFVDQYGQPVPTDIRLTKQLPPQAQDKELAASLEDASKNLGKGTQGIFAANFAVSFMLSASLQYLWEMINAQQLIVLMPLFKVQIPKSSEFVFSILMTIASFEIFPTDYIYENWFNSGEGHPLNMNFS